MLNDDVAVWTDVEETCLLCGGPTHWIDPNFEAPLCSSACVNDMRESYLAALRAPVSDWAEE